jgi:DNA modification methylase
MIRDSWQSDDGAIRLILGDCLSVLPGLSGIDAIVADPPYGMNAFDGSGTQRKYGMSRKNNWDKPVCKEALQFIATTGREHVIWGGNYYADILPAMKGWLVWTKPDAVPSMSSCEMAWTDLPINAKHINYSIAATNAERIGFPAQKPLKVMLFTIGFLGESVETVADPFMGSGTTGVACIRTGRRFIGIEINPEYYAIAKRRCIEELNRYPLLEPPRARQRSFLESSE